MPLSVSQFTAVAAVALTMVKMVRAETHTIVFENKCGIGTPMLIQGGNVLSTGASLTINGPFLAGIAYLQTGSCGFNGEGCTVVETTLKNPTSPGNGSSTDISLTPPHAFSAPTGFGYFNGCDGLGIDCTNPTCPIFGLPGDPSPRVVQCEVDDVNLAITFCD